MEELFVHTTEVHCLTPHYEGHQHHHYHQLWHSDQLHWLGFCMTKSDPHPTPSQPFSHQKYRSNLKYHLLIWGHCLYPTRKHHPKGSFLCHQWRKRKHYPGTSVVGSGEPCYQLEKGNGDHPLIQRPNTRTYCLTLDWMCLLPIQEYPSCHPPINPRKETTLDYKEQTGLCWYLDTELPEKFTEWAMDSYVINCIQQCRLKFLTPTATATIHKLTMSTDLAMQAEATKPRKTLPAEYAEFAQVFSKEATDHVSPSQPYDCYA